MSDLSKGVAPGDDGFKQTAVGPIPANWSCTTVAATAARIPNAIVGGPFGSDLVSKDYVTRGVPVIRGQNMGAQFIEEPFVYVTEAKAASLAANLARPGDLVFTQRGTLGQVSLVPNEPFGRYLVSQSQMKVTPNRDLVDPRFLHLLFSGPAHQKLINTNTIQTGVPHINLGVLRQIPVQLPPLPEQRAIAAALSDVDALIGALDRLIAKKRDLKQAAMQQLLAGQTRLPGFSGKWETKRVEQCGDVLAGKALNADGPGLLKPYLRTANVLDGSIDLDDVLEMPFTAPEFERFRLNHGDVLLNEGQSLELVGRCSMYRDELEKPCAMQNALLRFRARDEVSPEFAEHVFRYCQRSGIFARIATQTTSVAHLGSVRFAKLELPWPLDHAEQKERGGAFDHGRGAGCTEVASRQNSQAQARHDARAPNRKDSLGMSAVGEAERRTQQRVVKLFIDALHYAYLGNLSDRENANIIPGELEHFLFATQGYGEREDGEPLIRRAIDQLERTAGNTSPSIYDRNRAVYELLRYGVKLKPDAGTLTETVRLIDWGVPERNRFAIAEEVTVKPKDPKAHVKRPDIVLYVNGIALAVLELKRSSVSIAEGIRQNLNNQKRQFIQPFFSTMQLVMAGSDTEGLRYGTIETREKYYLTWKEPWQSEAVAPLADGELDHSLVQLCDKARFLELIHDFIVFDAGTKKLPRHNQYFGVRAAQAHVRRREGGIIWHTQGSGKSLTMVWLARWICENMTDSRVLIITDRIELDEQIEKVFVGVGEKIRRTKSGADMFALLNASGPALICSLIHKFGGKEDGEKVGDLRSFVEELKKSMPADFKPKGDLYVFVDECHRTQSGELHAAMTALLPNAMFIGFTGTPLLKADKKKSIELFGSYIHTYKFNEAVKDGVVLDLRYEARDIDQSITSQAKIDQWFEAKTRGLTPLARAQLKARWGTMQKVLSSQSRLQKIAADILLDMDTRDRLESGHGNAMLVAGSIYEACKFYELFAKTPLAGKCAIITSYAPTAASIKGEGGGEGATDSLEKYNIYRQMLADWFDEPPEQAVNRAEDFEKAVKKKFIEEPGQMRLLIVVDKLLTGFDAPPATYLYIDKQMRDHGLFQAICRVNRLDGDDKDFGYIVDYKDLFRHLEGAVNDYTSGALDGFDQEDVAGLLEDRVEQASESLEEALEAIRALCEPVRAPRQLEDYFRYFSSEEPGNAAQRAANEPQRLALYRLTAALVRAYANVANEMDAAGYSKQEALDIKHEVTEYERLRAAIKLHSADAIDLKQYEPAMRHLIDTYIRAEESERVSEFEDLSLIQLIVERGPAALEALPRAIRENQNAAAETIENNVRQLIVDESPLNPRYYQDMSALLDALIAERRANALDYQEYMHRVRDIARDARNGPKPNTRPATLDTPAKRALYDNLGNNEALALRVDDAVRAAGQDAWRSNAMKTRRVRQAIHRVLGDDEARVDLILDLVKNQNDY